MTIKKSSRPGNHNEDKGQHPVDQDRFTNRHRAHLEQWHQKEMDARIDELLDSDPAFRASMEAMDRADELDDIDIFDYGLAGDVASWATEGYSEADWFDSLADNKVMQTFFKIDKIPLDDISLKISCSVENLKLAGLWPWVWLVPSIVH